MTKKPELTFAAFIAASFLVCGLGAVIADSDTRTAAPAPTAAAQDSDLRRGARQTPDAEKRRRAHFLVDTSSGLEDARLQVAGILRAVAGMTGRQ